MKLTPKKCTGLFAVLLCLMLVLSMADTQERRYDTALDQSAMVVHIENLTANGPRSIYHTEANQLALEYITSCLHSWGVVPGDRTDAPAYVIQDFVTDDDDYQAFYLKNIIVHIPANAPDPTGKAVMFMGHTDSVPMGPGASDDGVAVAAMLEAIRHYLGRMEDGLIMKNDLVFCFVNGEEFGLYGSEAFMEEFAGFEDVVRRIRFGVNLESRGTDGTLIMFETAADNYESVKLFSQVNRNVFTSSVATMIYEMMPNGTDFSNFKEAYQGLNFANIGGGENYHTQNDDLEHLGGSYLSQNAMIVGDLIEKLGSYDLDSLHGAGTSAVFFSYLNLATPVYSHGVANALAAVLAVLLILLLLRIRGRVAATLRGAGALGFCLVLMAVVTQGLYYGFQYIAVLAGNLDIQAVGSVAFSNLAIVAGLGLMAAAVSVLGAKLWSRWTKTGSRDMVRGFALVHGVLGVALTVFVPDASYLFVFSGLMLVVWELIVSFRPGAAAYHGELLAVALYLPLIMPILVLATSALGLTMAWVFGLIFVLGIFVVGVDLAEARRGTPAAAALALCACVVLLSVSLTRPDASANLLGKQGNIRLPWDDALVYAVDAEGSREFRVYDLNVRSRMEEYVPGLEFRGEYYAAPASGPETDHAIRSAAQGSTLTIRKEQPENLIWLTFTDIRAESFTIDDGTTAITYPFGDRESYGMTIHSDCTVTVNGGAARVDYREVCFDCADAVPAGYAPDGQKLRFHLWMTAEFELN